MCTVDVDECAYLNGNCSQICVNTIGTYHCSCNCSYRLGADNSSCYCKRLIVTSSVLTRHLLVSSTLPSTLHVMLLASPPPPSPAPHYAASMPYPLCLHSIPNGLTCVTLIHVYCNSLYHLSLYCIRLSPFHSCHHSTPNYIAAFMQCHITCTVCTSRTLTLHTLSFIPSPHTRSHTHPPLIPLPTHILSSPHPPTHIPSSPHPHTHIPSFPHPPTHIPSSPHPPTHIPSSPHPPTHIPSSPHPPTHIPSSPHPPTHIPSSPHPPTHIPSSPHPPTHIPSSPHPLTHIPSSPTPPLIPPPTHTLTSPPQEHNCLSLLPVQCPTNLPPHLILEGSAYVNTQATFSCPQGYGLVGNITLQCASDGTWSAGFPQCVEGTSARTAEHLLHEGTMQPNLPIAVIPVVPGL